MTANFIQSAGYSFGVQHFLAENSCVLCLKRVKLMIVDQKNIGSFREQKNCCGFVFMGSDLD